MKFYVSKKRLLIIAGTIWIAAGANILYTGIGAWMAHGQMSLKMLGITAGVFLFFLFIFRKLSIKYTRRIKQKEERNNPLSFLDRRGWAVMLFMMGLGIALRSTDLLSSIFIATFYTGLSSALILGGGFFMRQALLINVCNSAPKSP